MNVHMHFINTIKEIAFKKYCSYQNRSIRRNFCKLREYEQQSGYYERSVNPLLDFEYKSDEWEPILHLSELLMAAWRHQTINLNDNTCQLSDRGEAKNDSLVIHSNKHNNNWLCFFYKHPLADNYMFEFDIVIHSEFKEVQIALKYRDLANRLRFMIRDNREAVFEVIKDGWFYKHIYVKPYYLKRGLVYRFKIIADNNKYGFYINDEEIFLIKQIKNIKGMGNGLCLILYNDDDSTEINCEITNIKISSMEFEL